VGPSNVCSAVTTGEVAVHVGLETIQAYVIPNLSVPPIKVVGMDWCFFAPGGPLTGDELVLGVTPPGADSAYAKAAFEEWKRDLSRPRLDDRPGAPPGGTVVDPLVAVDGLGVEAAWSPPANTLVVVTERQILALLVKAGSNRFGDDPQNLKRARRLAALILKRGVRPVTTERPEEFRPNPFGEDG